MDRTQKNLYKDMQNDLDAINNGNSSIYEGSAPMSTYEPLVSMPEATLPPAQHSSTQFSVVTAAPYFGGGTNVGPESTELNCPQCRCRIKTKVRHRSTVKTHIACILLAWTFCCCCLPYCMDSCRNANHFCPMCGAFIGTYQS